MKFRAGITGRRNSNERKTKSSCSGYNKIALGDGSEVPCNCDSSGRIECPAFLSAGTFGCQNSGFAGLPQLILVCEDEKHMAECFKEIVTNKVEIPQIKLLFTTDLRQNKDILDDTLVEFKLVDGKYKMEDVELKLLG